ncbi:SIS domain-containing protein [Salipiger sp.]|uniref:SIS domain-containing protein n=1 Tax=Salipiger sp. TaxID=2078585 RepID=UPI003A97C5AB
MTDTMKREIEAQGVLLAQIQQDLARSADAVDPAKGRVFVGGCGDSAYAPRALSGVFEALGLSFAARSSMELAAFTTFRPDDTVILSSISGGTKRTVEAAETVRRAGGRVIAVTCNADSALAEVANQTIPLPYRPISRKTPHTLDYSVTLLALVELARSFAGQAQEATRPLIARLPELITATREAACPVVQGYDPDGKIFILGVGPDLGTAEYGAAKFQEAGGLLAIAAETENFVHGANFMLEAGDTVIALGGSAAGHRRAQQVVEALGYVEINRHLFPEDPGTAGDWLTAFRTVFEQTFVLQHACLGVSTRLSLRLEEPRAGRHGGLVHQSMQQRMMAG